MNYYTRSILFLFICFITVPLNAQERLLTLSEARQHAVQTNKELKMATAEQRAAYYEKKEAYTKYFPDLSFSGSYLRNQKNLNLISSSSIPSSINIPSIGGVLPGIEYQITDEVRDKISRAGEVDIKNVWIGALSLVQPLFTGGQIVAYNDIRKNALELSKTKKDTKMQDIIVELDVAYWQVVSLSDKKKLAESYLKLLDKMYYDIKTMEEEGLATKADVLSVAVKKNEADLALTKVDNGLALSRMLLNQLCDFPIDEQITLIDEVNNIDIVEEQTKEIPHVQEALSNRSEIKSFELANKIYKGKEKVARSEFLPKLAFTANYLWMSPNFYDGMQNKLSGMWNVGVVLKIPLNVASSTYKYNAAKAESRIQEYKLEEAKEKIELQVNQSVFKLNEAYKKYRMTIKNMEKSDENLRYANAGFEEGVIPASDALTAHTAWLAAHSDMIDAQIDIKLSRVYLDKSLGRNLDTTQNLNNLGE